MTPKEPRRATGGRIRVRMLNRADAPLLRSMSEDVFDNPIDPRLAADFVDDPRHHMAIALVERRIIGIASAVHYVHPDKPPELWINEVGVAPAYRRKGVARRLLKALFAHAGELGCVQAWLLTEQDNDAARKLYADIGGEAETVDYYTFRLELE